MLLNYIYWYHMFVGAELGSTRIKSVQDIYIGVPAGFMYLTLHSNLFTVSVIFLTSCH